MAARKRAQERDYNRRRWLILDKGLEMAYNQKGTALGDCLLKWNVREETLLQRRQRLLKKQSDISVGEREQEKKLFVVLRDQAIREPTLLLERTPSAEQFPGYVDLKQPRYMRPLDSRQTKTPEFSTFSVFQAVKKRKRNPWEEAVKESVQFRPTLCPCARLSRQDTDKLVMDWALVNEKQTKALGLRSDNRSAPVKQVCTGLNPLNLPPRLNSQLHLLANDLLDGISTPGYTEDDEEESLRSDPLEVEEPQPDEAEPVFVTQLPQSQLQPRRSQVKSGATQQPQQQQEPHHHDLLLFEARDDTKKVKQAEHRQQVEGALVNIYSLLDQRRADGRPRIRQGPGGGRSRITYAHRQVPSATGASTTELQSTTAATPSASISISTSARPSRVSTAASAGPPGQRDSRVVVVRLPGQPDSQAREIRTTCRTEESIRILMEARRPRTELQRHQHRRRQLREAVPSAAADEGEPDGAKSQA
ncbi:hypothetical protein BOX15_Mlig018174g1 [Macrostomum lignano]|uniref:Uncharacterized protein n=1 Tax=Macrostomum lignano TaxID=282301 RepID=A0A267EWH5_9PLAT|nr:hypothetical protein BOX15_Mlig018174g1 [Macrostomum lignano]